MTSRRERNKLDKQRRIRDAAWSLFRELGFEGTTTKAIAERADIGKGTLFLYAKTKEDLLFLLFRDELERILRARVESAPNDASLVERLLHVFGGFYERYAQDPELAARFVRRLFVLEGSARESMRALDVALVAAILSMIETEKAQRRIAASTDARLLAMNVFAIYGMQVIDFLAHPERSVDDGLAVLSRALRMLVDGCRG